MHDDARRDQPREHDDRVGSHAADERERPKRDTTPPGATPRNGLTERERRERWPIG